MKYIPILLISLMALQCRNSAPKKTQPAETLIFSTRSAEDPNTRITFSVAFDKDQNAVITSSSSTAKQEDEESIHVYDNVRSMGGGEDDHEIIVELSETDTYWVIPFINPVPLQITGGAEIILVCSCRSGSQDAVGLAVGVITNWVVRFTCIPQEGCNRFNTGINQGTSSWVGPALVLKANSVMVR